MWSRGLNRDFSQPGSLSSPGSLPLLWARSVAHISPDDTTQATAQRHGDKKIMKIISKSTLPHKPHVTQCFDYTFSKTVESPSNTEPQTWHDEVAGTVSKESRARRRLDLRET